MLATVTVAVVALLLAFRAEASDPLLAVELSLQENTTDACTTCGCEMKGALRPGETQTWWMTFGEVQPDRETGWAVHGPAAFSYCGRGDFKSVKASFLATHGTPYLVVEAQVDHYGRDGYGAGTRVTWTASKLRKFNWRGQARYEKRVSELEWDASERVASIVPALIADGREQSSFRVFEVIASLRAEAVGAELTRYGTISVFGDYPGAWILLDGSLVARVVEESPVVLGPIPEGDHVVSVRDFSGRSIEQNIRVSAGTTTAVRLPLLGDLPGRQEAVLTALGRNAQGYEEFWRAKDRALMVHIPGGEFLMGSDDPWSEPDAGPERVVHVSGYLVDKTEVTWRQYRKFAEATGVELPPEPEWGRLDGYALSNTTWEEAAAYCSWIGGRLPTEAEWEKAARGTDGRTYPWGSDWDPDRCNSISGGMHQPEPVGSFPGCVSPYGVLDMVGSHWQWVQDYYSEVYYALSSNRDPGGPEDGRLRVRRGGYWMEHPQQLAVSRRGKADPEWRNFSHGFRCVIDAAGEAE